jgi:hypothetical protein
MNWLRLHHEARNDRKLESLNDAEFRVWFNLLVMSSEQPERGVITFDDLELLALEVARGDAELLTRTLDRLVKLRIVESVTGRDRADESFVHFINFEKRQYDKPSDAPSATRERKARQRLRERETGVTEDVSHDGHAMSRDVTPQNREEQIQNREEKRRGEGADALTPLDKSRGSRLPIEWGPSDADWTYAASKGFSPPEIDTMAEKFRNHWTGTPGQRGRKVDWSATWRNWVISDAEKRDTRQPSRASPRTNGRLNAGDFFAQAAALEAQEQRR